MAARSSSGDSDEEPEVGDTQAADMVEVDVVDAFDGLDDADLDETDIDASDLEDELDEELDDELDTLDDDVDDASDEDVTLLADDDDDDLDTSELVAAVATAAEVFDDEDLSAVVEDVDDGDVDGIRDGEFVCRSCYLAKRETQLADPKAMLCRDCA